MVQVANGCCIKTQAVNMSQSNTIATSPRKGAGRRGASRDSSLAMILYIYIYIKWVHGVPVFHCMGLDDSRNH